MENPQEEPDYTALLQQEEPKQETLKKAAEKYKYNPKGNFCFIEGAKWQMDKQEEFAIGFAEWCLNYIPENIITSKQLLEIYKKEKGL